MIFSRKAIFVRQTILAKEKFVLSLGNNNHIIWLGRGIMWIMTFFNKFKRLNFCITKVAIMDEKKTKHYI